MTTPVVTIPGTAVVMKPVSVSVKEEHICKAEGTYSVSFEAVRHQLSPKPLRRPTRLHPLPTLSNGALREAAQRYCPPAEWFDGEEERPF